MSSSGDNEGCIGIIAVLSLIYGAFYEMHTWVINTEAVAKRSIYYSQTINDTSMWLNDSDNYVSSFKKKRQSMDQLIETTTNKYAPLLNKLHIRLINEEKDLIKRINELEETLLLLGRDTLSDDQLLKWKATLITVQSSLAETKNLRKNLYIANQKSILMPDRSNAAKELESLIKYVVASTRTQQLTLERALSDG
ncbi:MAG: hypothetical protein CBC72_002375 [Gammaproteobacteria bacterium TMED112]|nr:MAG: hypothetical protein CBC72_002375 [Gammaproteobacteria bacterium TMED112]|tara:strand:+ start:3652 stop:4236 length:585 start_codon:yes stop_codon:yes gene_type:complete